MFWRRKQDTIELGTTGRLGLSRYRVHARERTTHMYVVGITGKGKSKLLEHVLFQDITDGRGSGVLDPHSDLVEDRLRYLLSHPNKAAPHWDRILYFDPARTDYLVPSNVLATDRAPYETAQNVVEAFRRTCPARSRATCAASCMASPSVASSALSHNQPAQAQDPQACHYAMLPSV